MRRVLRSGDVIGREVVDVGGETIGRVVGTWPRDGGGEVEMTLVALGLGRFARRRYLPVGELLEGNRMQVPWTAGEVEDAPDVVEEAWDDPAVVARAYWALASQ